MTKLPKFLKKYFWDVEFDKLRLEHGRQDVLCRMLEYGDKTAVNWMSKHFTKHQIAYALTHFRMVSPMSANFWAVVFGIDKKKILCLQKPYLKKLKTL
ncbi:MAG: hypothetical protein AB1755_01360 [Candidatus Omnitrophota bacterium]